MNTSPENTLSSPPTTIKAVKEAGFRARKDWEYGGEEITVKGRLLVRNPKEALSQTEWSRRGFRVRKDAQPLCIRSASLQAGKTVRYPVYREDQVEPKRQVSSPLPVQIDILAALWVANRRAKRCRDLSSKYYTRRMHGFAASAKREKSKIYRLKGQILCYLLLEKQLEIVGYHRFRDGNWAEVLWGRGYTFHRPCPACEGKAVQNCREIDAKPKGATEPRLRDALHTLDTYLVGKPHVGVYEWPTKEHPTRRHRAYRPPPENDWLDGTNDEEVGVLE